MIFIVPMAGLGSRFPKKDWGTTKPLIRIDGKSLLEYSIRSLPLSRGDHIRFIITRNEFTREIFHEISKLKIPISVDITVLNEQTCGQAETVFRSIRSMDFDEELMIHNCDSAMNLSSKRNFKSDGGLFVFTSTEQRWSYARTLNESDEVLEVREKEVISENASTGTYSFKTAMLFRDAYKKHFEFAPPEERYVSPLYNELITDKLRVNILRVNDFFCLGTPLDLSNNKVPLKKRWKPLWG